jgi:Na+(H+)/acetate symporter ActP
VITRKAIAAIVALACVPAVVAGVVLGVAVAVTYDRLRNAFADPFGYWEEGTD